MTYAEYERLEREYYSQPVPDPGFTKPVAPPGYAAWVQAGRPQGNYSSSNPYSPPGSGGGGGLGGGGGTAPAPPASNAVEQVLAAFPFLNELGPEIYQILVDGILANDPYDVIVSDVRQSSPYKKRFKGMASRQNSGHSAITEAEYLDLERGYLNQLREFNVAATLGLNSTEEFREWASDKIAGDVSVQELNRRLDRAAGLARDSSDQVQSAFQQWYGVDISEEAMITYFLDNDRGLNVIEDQLAAAQIGGEALSRGLQINRTRAEILRREGVTADLARQGFSDIAREKQVLGRLAQIHNTTPLSQLELEEFFFHQDADVAARRNRTFTQALSTFQAGSPSSTSREGGLTQFLDRNRAV